MQKQLNTKVAQKYSAYVCVCVCVCVCCFSVQILEYSDLIYFKKKEKKKENYLRVLRLLLSLYVHASLSPLCPLPPNKDLSVTVFEYEWEP